MINPPRQIAVFLVFLFPIIISATESCSSFCGDANLFFVQYADAGALHYQLVKKDPSRLDSLLATLSRYDFTGENDTAQKAYLVNAYNLFVIETVLKYYPVSSPRDISGFYDREKHRLNNTEITLDELENTFLRARFHDPRFHFALVCGAKGCPPIASFAYQPSLLDDQLTRQTKKAIDDPGFIRINDEKQEVSISELFKWYETDFTANYKSVLQFINAYRSEKIPETYSIGYYDYDWRLNDFPDAEPSVKGSGQNSGLQSYTPSVLLGKGQWEYKFFNNLYTQTAGYGPDGNRLEYHSRSSYFSSINQFLIGVNPRINVGFDLWIKSVRNDSEASSPFALLKFENNTNSRTAVSGIGPKIKVAPFRKLSHLSIQSTFLIPVARDQEGADNGKPYLSADRYFLITQLFYDKPVGTKFQLFFQVAPWISVNKRFEVKTFNLATPADIFFSWFPTTRTTVYFQNEWWPSYGHSGISSWFRQEGIGMKFQVIPGMLEMEILYSRFSMGKNAGAGQTYNFGIRIIR